MNFLVILSIAIASGASCTWMIRLWAVKNNIVSKPNPLIPQHTKPVAYLGGVGLYGGLCISIITSFIFFSECREYFRTIPLISFVLGGTGYLILGVMDDLYTFSAKKKLVWQFILAVASAYLGLRFIFFNTPLLDFIFTVFWIVIIVNAANLTDVCDGLVSGLCVIVFIIPTFFNPELSSFGIIISGVTMGFLFFNLPKASIFLGDAGSHLLGFLLAALCILGFPHTHSIISKLSWMIFLPGVMLFELIFLTIVRVSKGLPWWKGSPDHFSLRLQSAGFNRIQTDIIAWGVCILLVVTACSLPYAIISIQYVLLISMLFLLFLIWRYLLKHEVK